MDKAEYIRWKETRADNAAYWRPEDCIAADRLVKKTALTNFKVWVETNIQSPVVGQFLQAVVSVHFGSMDVDNMLTELGMYPDWI